MKDNETGAAISPVLSNAGLERCGACGEELFGHEHGYCEDCRDVGDLEEILEIAYE